jgi:hypothetical protein
MRLAKWTQLPGIGTEDFASSSSMFKATTKTNRQSNQAHDGHPSEYDNAALCSPPRSSSDAGAPGTPCAGEATTMKNNNFFSSFFKTCCHIHIFAY